MNRPYLSYVAAAAAAAAQTDEMNLAGFVL